MELEGAAREAVHSLNRKQRSVLIEQWRLQTRLISITPAEAILDRYGLFVLDILINRARSAGARTSF